MNTLGHDKLARGGDQSGLEDSGVRCELLDPATMTPLLIRPDIQGMDFAVWAKGNRQYANNKLRVHGALLFRGFNINTVERFEKAVEAVAGKPMEYRERSSPRSQVGAHVYTSTDHPPNQSIFLHNEHSYSMTFPLKLFFCCIEVALDGGETPLADTRKIFSRITPETRRRFIEKRWMFVRNYSERIGLPWQVVFQTTDKSVVEYYCRRSRVECEWVGNNRLRTRQVRPAVAKHPRTGEMVWFNHASFFHITTLEKEIREALLAEYNEEDLPNNTYYGDGSPIEDSVMDELREAYLQEKIIFSWQKGDLVMLDNMATAHGRNPFIGDRKVLFAMAEPITRTDL